jgi:hypothetical protein
MQPRSLRGICAGCLCPAIQQQPLDGLLADAGNFGETARLLFATAIA